MGKMRDFDSILDECLERVLRRGETIEQCLASYPEQAAELAPLLRTALTTNQVSAIRPRPEFRNRARYEFNLAVQRAQEKKGRRLIGWQPRWSTVAIAVLVVVVGGSSTVAAASNSMPDDVLYPVKLTTETVRLELTRAPLDKAQLYAKLADKRVAEIIKMADRDKPEQVERATQRLDAYLEKVASLTAPPEKRAGALMAPAPVPAPTPTPTSAPAPRPTLASPTAPPSVAAQAPKAPEASVAPAPGQAKKNGKEDAAKINQRAKVKAIVARAAVEHKEALRAALQTAPEPVKAAVRRAIAVSDARYQQALDALGR